ncbi:dermatopontin-like [Mya arenaria]|uniref:dermatopontin-like n=1 Tax=Mya arenaria TaxID=6604 RepID=UPI0022E01037|nr:dermatopontin-like [Mya arenaria]
MDRRHTIAYLIVSLLLIGKASAVNYVNNLDAEFFFECPNPDEFVSHMESVHDNGAEDRRFAFSCKKVTSNGELHAGVHCLQKSGYQNTYDHLLAFQCSDNSFINGMGSRHDNGAEDRIWQFKCCDIPGIHMDDCKYTDWTNELDQPQTFNAENGYVTRGVVSEHDNGAEDRRYKFEICLPMAGETAPVVG